ncbi:Bug family tripartite tricarboxylate transporter substrate binding protein [Bordetella bronchialis]|uniref:Bug family tripartite tricarboxylate transporter substrate binding protein n=1 Tax=Bordetella bronchialis TaxID=463025 RepID=UPI003D05B39D
MFERRRKALAAALAGAVAGMYPWNSHSLPEPKWPAAPIKMVVPFPPGGPTDLVARLLAGQIARQLQTMVVVQNIPGANGIVGVRSVAGAMADGYTVLFNTSSLVLSPSLYVDPGFDPAKDFDAVSSTVAMPLVLLVHPDVPAQDFHSFLRYARQRAGNLSYASAGGGNVTHLATVLLLQATGISAMHVPYRGSAPALAGLMGKQAQFMVNPLCDALPHVQAGRLRALAVTSTQRVGVLPGVPTVAELGIAGFEVQAWHGVVVPKGTPAPVVQQLNSAIRAALASQDVQAQLVQRGARILGSTPEDYARYIHEEELRWSAVIRAADIRPD